MSWVPFLILYLNLKDKRFSWRCVVWYKVCCDFQLNRVKLVEKEKNALEGEKNKAVDFLTLENDIFRHKSRLCQYHVWVHQHLFKTWNHIISFHFCGHSTGEVVAFICYSWCFVTGLWGVFFFQYFPQSRSTETCGGQRGREEDDFGGHKGTDREKRKDIPGNRENEPGAEKRWEVRHFVSSIDQFNVRWKSNLYLNAVILWLPEESK